MRPQASFAMLSIGFALFSSGCPATYITVSSDAGATGGAAGESAAGAAGMYEQGGVGGGYVGGAGGDYYAGVGGGYVGGAAGDYYGGAGGDYYAGAGGYAGEPCNVGGTGGYGCDTGCGIAGTGAGGYGCDTGCGVAGTGIGGAGGAAGIGLGGAGGDPCFNQFGNDPPLICACYYGTNNTDYYGCLNRYDAQNGGVGGAPADLCEHLAPWSVEHERCVNYYSNGGAGSFEEQGGAGGATGGGCAGAPGDPAYDNCAGGAGGVGGDPI